ncbi:MAG: hypothetical protein GY754_43875 [bacterium]|nr:hypothetical protein [bacterium]
MQQIEDNEIVFIRKVKKDGSINKMILSKLVEVLKQDGLILLPIDSIYGVLGLLSSDPREKMAGVTGQDAGSMVHMISNFKMLDDIADINKREFDFLHRVWPGEVEVFLPKKDMGEDGPVVPIRMPKSRFVLDLISRVDAPLLFAPAVGTRKKYIHSDRELVRKYKDRVDMVFVVKEFCKEHTSPTVVDISKGNLEIINRGRVSIDEMKSLYFLDAE